MPRLRDVLVGHLHRAQQFALLVVQLRQRQRQLLPLLAGPFGQQLQRFGEVLDAAIRVAARLAVAIRQLERRCVRIRWKRQQQIGQHCALLD